MVALPALVSRVEQLETVALEQASRIDDLEEMIRGLVARLPQPESSADEAVVAQPGSSEEPEVFPLAVDHLHPVNRVRKYYVVVVSVREDALEGIYTEYGDYCYAVKDHSQTDWSGRGNIPFARGVASHSFAARSEAEAYFRSETGLSAEEPVPYRRTAPASRQLRRTPTTEPVRQTLVVNA